MDLYDLSREIKSFLGQDRRDVGDLIHRERASLVLVDGLGWNIAKDLEASVAPMKISSVFPTITVTVFATLLTAKRPGEHGILGWRLLDREEGRIVNLLETLKEEPLELETFFEGTDSLFVMPEAATRGLMGKLRVVPYYTYWDGLYKYRKAMEEGHKFVFFYIPYVDATSHINGPFHEATLAAAREIMTTLDRVAVSFRESYTVLITADHGHVALERNFDLWEDREFMEEMEFPPYGDSRNLMIKGKLPKSLAKYGTVYERGKVVELVGGTKNVPDFLLVPHDNTNVVYWKDEMEHLHRGGHGGMTKDEMEVPLYVYE